MISFLALESGEIRTKALAQESIGIEKMRATVWAYNSLPANTIDAKIKFCQKMKYLIE